MVAIVAADAVGTVAVTTTPLAVVKLVVLVAVVDLVIILHLAR
jgi:hypothetical protein